MEHQEHFSSAISELESGLRVIGSKIELWRLAATRIRMLATLADASQTLDEELLMQVEAISGEIYLEIAAFDRIVEDLGKISTESAAQLAEIGDALRLVLLEITELGTHLDSIRSGVNAPAA
jgi:hypothetical protein